jgi:hypothetical protein
LSTPGVEEILHELDTIFFHDSGYDVYGVIQAVIVAEVVNGPGSAPFRITPAEYQPADPRMDGCHHAHRARLQGDDQGGAMKPVVPVNGSGAPQCQNFRMSGRIMKRNGLIMSLRDNEPLGISQDGPHRNFSLKEGLPGLPQGFLHENTI